jgi:hypothetical protein
MSCWDIGDGGVIGDGPADVLTVALARVAHEREEPGRSKPSLASVLGGVATAVAEGAESRPGIVVTLEGGVEISADDSSDDIAILLREALAEIRRQYEERRGRAPERREILETLLFALVGDGGSFVRDVEPDKIRSLEERS